VRGFTPSANECVGIGTLQAAPDTNARIRRAFSFSAGLLQQPVPGDRARVLEAAVAVDIEVESHLITWALKVSHGNKSKAAELLQIKRSTLGDRINRCGLSGSERLESQPQSVAVQTA